MKIKIRHHDASMPQDASMPRDEDWSPAGDWFGEPRGDGHGEPPGGGHAEPGGAGDPWPGILAQADARAQADGRAQPPGEAAVMPAAVTAAGPATGPGQLAAAAGPAQATPLAAVQRTGPRPLEVAQCAMCGTALPLGLLVPDGGQACADVRWYCKDAMACTGRWTTARPPGRAHLPAAPGRSAAAGEAAPDRAPAERPGGLAEAARPAV